MHSIDTDVLVIGGGAAGLSAALAAAPRRVLVVSADDPRVASSTALAQGGLAVPIGEGDSVEAQMADTLAAGGHSCDRRAALRVIRGAVEAVGFLCDIGVPFDRDASGWRLHREAGHSRARVLHARGDRTGAALLAALLEAVARAVHIEMLCGVSAMTLRESATGRICGAWGADRAGGAVRIESRDTVLATGGLGRLFPFTTNGPGAQGDGLAMALGHGAHVAGLEFIQFHPTALAASEDPAPLLTEALRGAGAVLLDGRGQRFMRALHPLAELAPRDVVARAVWSRRLRGEPVRLDATEVFRSARAEEFPAALATCRAHGIDPASEPIPVTTAAHYHMGGVVVDRLGRSTRAGLWACGEVAWTGMHGANRLASNSLLEAVVCGRTVGHALAREHDPMRRIDVRRCREAPPRLESHPVATPGLREVLGRCMGPLRHGSDLEQGARELVALGDEIAPEALIARRRLELALAMVRAALDRRESRGAHWRADYPSRDANRDAR
ncbi:MAG: L-aspartate oxidase [Steroidobacteraceae bacterium]